jgi:hypothetical protein
MNTYRQSVFGFALLCYSLLGYAEEPVCDGSAATVTASPHGKLLASVQERVCTTEKGAAANVQVTLAPKDSPDDRILVVATAVPRTREEWPKAVWRNETLLEVWVPNLAHVVEVKPSFADVQVVLKYCGDDPAARASLVQYQVDLKKWMEQVTRWTQLRKIDAEAAGPRPPRPEEPRVSNQLCRAGDIP